jgi:hypothetical protein
MLRDKIAALEKEIEVYREREDRAKAEPDNGRQVNNLLK